MQDINAFKQLAKVLVLHIVLRTQKKRTVKWPGGEAGETLTSHSLVLSCDWSRPY